MEEIFVTYAWGNEVENNKVYYLVDELRRAGFYATCDIMKMQEQTAINFKEMMQEGLNNNKVIIVLSEKYKEKADGFKDGAGTEYRTIINDIEEENNKYILVSFNEVTKESLKNICPYMLKERYVIDLNREDALNELFSKIKGEKIFEFSEVSANKAKIESKKIQPLFFEKRNQRLNSDKHYIDDAIEFINSLGISITQESYSQMKGTNLNTGIEELEDGMVLTFTCDSFNIIDNNVMYYYNVKNKVLYKYQDHKFEKICSINSNNTATSRLKDDFNSLIIQEKILEFIRIDPLGGIPNYLPGNVDVFCITVREKLDEAILLQNDDIFKAIDKFINVLDSYNSYLAMQMYSTNSGCYSFQTNKKFTNIDEIREKINSVKVELNQIYSVINRECFIFY